jgi:hypothetical protein
MSVADDSVVRLALATSGTRLRRSTRPTDVAWIPGRTVRP